MEKLVRKNCKTSANLPKYVHNFVSKIRPLYVELGSKLSNITCNDPYIMICPSHTGDKLAVFSKDHTNSDAEWNFESLSPVSSRKHASRNLSLKPKLINA